MASRDDLRNTFFEECEDLLERLADGLRALVADNGADQVETVHAVFRAVHSIKGGAAAFGLDELVRFAHLYETVLDGLRNGRIPRAQPLIETLLRAADLLADLVLAARDGQSVPAERITRLQEELDHQADHHPEAEGDFVFEPLPLQFGSDPAPAIGELSEVFCIQFRPRGDLYATGNEPVGLLKALSELGKAEITTEIGEIRSLSAFNVAEPGLRWEILLTGGLTTQEISGVFEFVEDLADLKITGAPPTVPEVKEEQQPGVKILPPPAKTTSASPTDGKVISLPTPATIRVNLDRVDRLINLIGELVIMEAMLSQIISGAGIAENSEVSGGLDRIRQLASEIQESVMAIRAQPLRPVFQRMERILREVSDATGKKARLVTIGDTTEVDKTVIERLVDPLTHMIRNSVDHGLEDPARRLDLGKPAEGTITLSAAHRSGRVVIEVADDGGGIDRARVRKIAEERGLIQPGAALSPSEIEGLLFLPGFSSKSDVSAISGRGVGLDVVRREIQSLGGRVTIASADGAGTTFTIALPLTLAVLEGMLLEFATQTMVLPLSAIVETLSPASATIHNLGRAGRVVANRGELIPIIELARIFGLTKDTPASHIGVLVVIETDGGARAALAVDQILDQRQVVIKSLEDNYGLVPGISAATILGDGRISLILDPEEVVRMAQTAPRPAMIHLKG